MTNPIKFNITTYTSFAHNYVIAILSTNEAEYRFDVEQSDQTYSRFVVLADYNMFSRIRDMITSNTNDGNAISIEYGNA